jgi:hypothetical protein
MPASLDGGIRLFQTDAEMQGRQEAGGPRKAFNLKNFPLKVSIIVVNRMLRLRLAGKF